MSQRWIKDGHCLDCGALCWGARCDYCNRLARGGSNWAPDRDAELERRWLRGDRTADIAVGLGVTKNAVIGKAHRLGLGKHPNAGPLQSHRWAKMNKGPHPYEVIGPRDCRWPIGDPKSLDFHFCGEPADEKQSYCAKHQAMAYARPKALEAAE